MTTTGHNSLTPDLLKQTVAKIERVNDEIKGLMLDRAELFKEAKGNGLDTKIIRSIIRERAMDAEKLAEYHALMETYRAALGDFVSTELGKAGVPR